MAVLSSQTRSRLPARAFAYVDSNGRRRLPIHDGSHVRNALARFDQVGFESDEARELARERLMRAAKRYGIVPVGFIGGQLRKERSRGELLARSGRELPRGTLAFLLTDIEGSTRLLRRLGARYASVLRRVRAIIRGGVRRAGGYEVDCRADEFFGVFEEASAALTAALAIQRDLAARAWPDGSEVRVRIGIHHGRTTLTETGYVGIAVHTAARVSAAAHGGQILVSAAARAALDGADDGIRFKSLGRFRLSGLPRPQPLHQAIAPGLRSRFPPPRSAS
jgi:class 3 adenylate cyclase